MNGKLAIALVLGLVFQLVQILPAVPVTSPCQVEMESCTCCAGGMSCDCAEDGEPGQNPTPAPFETDRTLKLPAMSVAGIGVSMPSHREDCLAPRVGAAQLLEPVWGFVGVRLSVAFCSFVN